MRQNQQRRRSQPENARAYALNAEEITDEHSQEEVAVGRTISDELEEDCFPEAASLSDAGWPEDEELYFCAVEDSTPPLQPQYVHIPERAMLPDMFQIYSSKVGMTDGPQSDGFAIDTHCKLLINGKKAMARYDTQATISCADPSIFKHLNIEASEGNLRLRGAITQKEGLKYAMVKMESIKGSITTRLMCHTLGEG